MAYQILCIVPLGEATAGCEHEITVGQGMNLLKSIKSLVSCQICESIGIVALVKRAISTKCYMESRKTGFVPGKAELLGNSYNV